jgi:hypothetical protein
LNVALILAAVIASVALLMLVFSAIARATAASARRKIDARFPADSIVFSDDVANFFGRTSKGPFQLRGNGGLVLTRDTLWFLPIVGEEMSFPLAEITKVSTVKSHLGKTVGRRLLKVEWADDSVAFFVRDVNAWQQRLAKP